MVCYLCHREVESNLFLLNRTVLIFPNQPLILPTHTDSDGFCAGGKILPVSGFRLRSPRPGEDPVVFTWGGPKKGRTRNVACCVACCGSSVLSVFMAAGLSDVLLLNLCAHIDSTHAYALQHNSSQCFLNTSSVATWPLWFIWIPGWTEIQL